MIDLCNVVHLTIWLLCAESDGGIRFYDATNGVPADPVDGAAKRSKKRVVARRGGVCFVSKRVSKILLMKNIKKLFLLTFLLLRGLDRLASYYGSS